MPIVNSADGNVGSQNWEHPQYTATKEAVFRMRTSVAGEAAVKDAGTRLLPHPCPDPQQRQKPEEQGRYTTYLEYAEYENVPGNTLDTLLGAMFRNEPELEAHNEQIVEDADGNGISLSESIELTASECLQMRFEGLLAEYSDLAGEDITEITVQEARERNLRSTIKHYPRESITDWSYRTINGTRQLNMVVLQERSLRVTAPETVGKTGTSHDWVESYLILGLDTAGEYFQRRCVIQSDKRSGSEGISEPVYPEANGSRLNFIPFEFVMATERQTGDIPWQLGYLDPISSKTIHRYQVSALLKEALRITAQPTSYTKGWTKSALDIYFTATGEKEVKLGSRRHLPLPTGVDIGYLEWSADSNALFKYMEENKNSLIALGAVFNETGEQAETATAAAINSAEKKGVLSTLVKNIEESYNRVLGWCAAFDGVENPLIEVTLNREFVATMIDASVRSAIVQEYLQALISKQEALRQLKRGGATVEDIEVILDEIDAEGG